MMEVHEMAPAKINLTLDVVGKRDDGYHEVEMIMTAIDLSDQICLTPRADGQVVVQSSSGYIPLDQRNSAWQAAQLLKEEYGVADGVNIYIEKKIPVAAGLAGGSSDAAAVLRGCNRLWNLDLTLERLAELGARVGSDVPFCLYRGTALATGRGERIAPLPPLPPCWVVLAKPPIGVSTAEIYQSLKWEQIAEHPDTKGVIEALHRKHFHGVASRLKNVLEPVTFEKHPEVAALKEKMLHFGADGVCMTGTGPTVYALLAQESRALRLYHALKGFCKEVYMVRNLVLS